MDVLPCPTCGIRVFPESCLCANGHEIAYDARARTLVEAAAAPCCANRDRLGCSWTAAAEGELCLSCATTTVVPDLSAPGAEALFAATEAAKRWVLNGLMRLGWFLGETPELPEFRLMSEKIKGRRQVVMMGHADGVITLNIMEADPATAIRRKQEFDEPIRSMIGHVRHETAHFLHDRLGREQPGFLPAFRNLMGDERADYGEALERYYDQGPPPGWQDTHISEYAAAHPHEDWAESAANALHLEDLAQSAAELGIRVEGETMLDRAQTAGIGLNHMCRALGQPDPYPMVISPAVREKIEFALSWLDRRRRG
ncbi:putative zinc-binding metallopeptidase [Mangrovicoccus algicola]|uniref:Putative zinc-binding metallopeptidase n=1 Tax=Mangrovicoccus algicola TaxID=2771008 RepID=A0A8J6YV87_9RHOB|nr:putative zinc-binding metallopeptidase [Mangrovicoccus algicola]MBE3638387.1 putative zinc-binding metallopeptidase [Mangrovicoccus algicola]